MSRFEHGGADGVAWFRVRPRSWGLWCKWAPDSDLFGTRKNAHYVGRFRWKVLRPAGEPDECRAGST